jgi:hypothetical protein
MVLDAIPVLVWFLLELQGVENECGFEMSWVQDRVIGFLDRTVYLAALWEPSLAKQATSKREYILHFYDQDLQVTCYWSSNRSGRRSRGRMADYGITME